jgi:methyltransferase (TIGR00027 family)
MAEVKDVSGTAFVVAEFRAEENRESNPLYRDQIVELFLDADTRYAAGLIARSFPAAGELVRIRTKYLDDTLDSHIAAGFRQVVILGAGLDTRAVRKRTSGVTYFEIDDAATMTLKRARYEQRGIDADVRFIPGNYVTDGLIDLLDRNGFDADVPTYFLWEGNTMYLPLETDKIVLTTIDTAVSRFRVSFDYMAEVVIARKTGDAAITKLVDSFADMGAPWVTGIGDVTALAASLGLLVVENFKTAELYRRYWLDRHMTSPLFEFYSVCTLESSAR